MSQNTWPGQQLLPRRLRGGPKDDSVFARKPCVLQHLTTPRRLRDDSVSAFYQHGNDSARAPSTPYFHENAVFYNTGRLRFCRMYHVLRLRERPSDSEHSRTCCDLQHGQLRCRRHKTTHRRRGAPRSPVVSLFKFVSLERGVLRLRANALHKSAMGLRERGVQTPRGIREDSARTPR